MKHILLFFVLANISILCFSSNIFKSNINNDLNKLSKSFTETFTGQDSIIGCQGIVPSTSDKFSENIVFNPQGINDEFSFKSNNGGFDKYKLTIFNRWGEIVFETEDQNIGWTGTNKTSNKIVPGGVYYYTFEYQLINNYQKLSCKGTITVIR